VHPPVTLALTVNLPPPQSMVVAGETGTGGPMLQLIGVEVTLVQHWWLQLLLSVTSTQYSPASVALSVEPVAPPIGLPEGWDH
jgi:hypothetical protein